MRKGSLLLISVITLVLLATYNLKVLKVSTSSMLPTLLEGDHLVFNIKQTKKTYRRGDIVLFNLTQAKSIVKRIIAVGGDTIIYKNKLVYLYRPCSLLSNKAPVLNCDSFETISGDLVTNHHYKEKNYPLTIYNASLDEHSFEYANTEVVPDNAEHFYKQEGNELATWVVPQGSYFVMGDNRDHSLDSRYFGFVQHKWIKGQLEFTW